MAISAPHGLPATRLSTSYVHSSGRSSGQYMLCVYSLGLETSEPHTVCRIVSKQQMGWCGKDLVNLSDGVSAHQTGSNKKVHRPASEISGEKRAVADTL